MSFNTAVHMIIHGCFAAVGYSAWCKLHQRRRRSVLMARIGEETIKMAVCQAARHDQRQWTRKG